MKCTLSSIAGFILIASNHLFSQCTPVNCIGTLPAYGGICDTNLLAGRVNVLYSDAESFHTTTACFDAGIISPANAGTAIKVSMLKTFTYAQLPAGITGASNQSTYTSPANGCVAFNGIPTEAGRFRVTINFLVDINAYPLGGGTCTGFALAQNNNASNYKANLIILPDPSFTGLQSTYCSSDAPVTLTVTGTTGGNFSGAGISGTTFDPSTAGVGTHIIKYIVSVQQGAAIAPATDSSSFTVNVVTAGIYYQDNDGDNFGNAAVSQFACVPPSGYVTDSSDCDDTNVLINPATVWYADNDIDGFGNTNSSVMQCLQPINYVLNNQDCNDSDNAVNPNAAEIPNDGIDNDCRNGDSVLTAISEVQTARFSIYPNPGRTELFISFDNSVNESVLIQLMSVDGRLIVEERSTTNKKGNVVKLNTDTLHAGLYFVKLISGNCTLNYRWVKME